MKTLLLKTKFILLAIILALGASCTPEDGAPGPIGPEGPAGVDGVNGNANVTSVVFEDQTINNGDNTFTIPQITQDIFDHGIVYAYVTVDGNNYWEVLPLSISGTIILEIDRIEVGQAILKATFTQSNLRLRFVMVEGNLASRTSVDVSQMSYEEAMLYFGLKP